MATAVARKEPDMMMGGAEGLRGVNVLRTTLVSTLKDNLKKHKTAYEESVKGYREEAIKELTLMLTDANSGKHIRRSLRLEEPQSHEKDYTRIILMLEMCTEEKVFIDESEFAQYVQDDWNWKAKFVETTSNYANRGR
jgi:hypothetical protein